MNGLYLILNELSNLRLAKGLSEKKEGMKN
jgi:hypothetical protein